VTRVNFSVWVVEIFESVLGTKLLHALDGLSSALWEIRVRVLKKTAVKH